MKIKPSALAIGLWTGIFIIATGTIFYVCKFWKNPLGNEILFSNDPAQWGQLGDYMNFYVSIASLIVISVLTYRIHEIEQERIKIQDKEAVSRENEQHEFQKELQRQRENFEYALEVV